MTTDGLLIGAARTVVTPPVGVSLAGSYNDRRADGVHDNIYARAVVIDEGNTQVAIVSVDVIGVSRATCAGARRLIEQACGIAADHVLIAATHNHSGPLTREREASGLAGEPDEPYMAYLERQVASAVRLAFSRRLPAQLRLALGEEGGIAFNRRFWMREGPVQTNPGKLNPDIVRTAGPVDQRVWTLTALPVVEGMPTEGSQAVPPAVLPLAVLVNFGLHPAIVAGTSICGDFPSFLETGVQRLIGPSGNGGAPPGGVASNQTAPVVLFANAPCADVNHIDFLHGPRQAGLAEAARVGTILAGEVVKGTCRLVVDWQAESTQRGIRAARRLVDLPLRRPAPEQVAWARQAAGGQMTMKAGAGLEVVEAQRVLALADGWQGATRQTEVQALAIGDELAIVGLPGEIFAELGLDVRTRSPFRHTLVLGLANDAIGYVPTRRAYDEGGYEPTASRFEPGSGERLVEEALMLLEGLRR